MNKTAKKYWITGTCIVLLFLSVQTGFSVPVFSGGLMQERVRFVRKQILEKDINVQWYYYQQEGAGSEIIEVTSKGKNKIIYEATGVITNVSVKQNRIIIKLYQPQQSLVQTKKVDPSVFGYSIVLDSQATYEEFQSIPKGVKVGF